MSTTPEMPRAASHVLEIVLLSLAFVAGVVIMIVGAATTPPVADAKQVGSDPQPVVTAPVDDSPTAGEGDGTDPIRLVNGRASAAGVDFDCHQLDLTFSWELAPGEVLAEPEPAILDIKGPVFVGKTKSFAFHDVVHQSAVIVEDGSHMWTADVIRIGDRPVIAEKLTARFKTTC